MKYSKAIKLFNEFAEYSDNAMAYITHYLHNYGYKSGASYARYARKYFNGNISCNKNYTVREEAEHPYMTLFPMEWDIPYPPPKQHSFTFVDLFAGIGGFRIAFQNIGGKCIFSCERNSFAKKTYERNFGEVPFGDIREFTGLEVSDKELDKRIPDHDVLTAGFPCQPFSIAGVSKKNSLGCKHGFEDPAQGTLFFDIKRILKVKRPAAFFLENVKNILHHDNGKTFDVINKSLRDLGYVFDYKIVDAAKWVPQHRERIFIVGFNPVKIKSISVEDIMIPEHPDEKYKYRKFRDLIENNVSDKYTLGPGTWDTLERHKAHHAMVGNGFGYGLHRFPIDDNTVTRTISARYHKDGAEILIEQKGKRPRRLTVTEAMQLQGFDKRKYIFPVSLTQAYRQIGNSVAVPAIQATAENIVALLVKRGYLKRGH